jgi:DNA repair exonuclease SbcCD nuclease subunit
MPLKILHTADVHLGAKFLALGRKGQEQRSRLLQAFDDTVNLAIREKVDIFLIAGDLFDSNAVARTLLAQIVYRFQDLSTMGIPIFVTPGTHDPYGPDSIYRAPELAGIKGLTVFKDEEMTPVRLPDLECTVYGNANTKPFKNRYPLESLEVDADSRWHIGMVHACYEIPDLTEDTYLVTPEQVASSGLDYLALGHIHSFTDHSQGEVTAFYSGSPEMVRMQKGDTGNVLVVELGDEEIWVRPHRTGRISYEELTVKAEDADAIGLVSMLESRANPDKVVQIYIDGMRPPGFPDAAEIIDELSDLFFTIKVVDRSWPAPSTLDPGAYPAGSPAAEYLRILQSRLERASSSESEEIQEAMQVGLSMLVEENG